MPFAWGHDMQKGRIELRGNCWLLRYYVPVLNEMTGKVEGKPASKKLATFSKGGYDSEKKVRPLADAILAPINARTNPAESATTLKTFAKDVFLVEELPALKPSTQRTYQQLWRYVEPHANGDVMRDMRVSDIERILRNVAGVDAAGKLLPGREQLAHSTIMKTKRFLSIVFRAARRRDLINNDPVSDAKMPRGKGADTYAYSLEEVTRMLHVLPDTTAKMAVMLAALTGLRPGEIKGLRWKDYDGDTLNVQQSVWNGFIGDVKTLDSKAPVPVVEPLHDALEVHRTRVPNSPDAYIFAGERCGRPLRLENELRCKMLPVFKAAKIQWHGWYAFRRGAATILHQLGVDDKLIQSILRHSDVATTQRHYIKAVPAEVRAAMHKLAVAFKSQAVLVQ
jgi:integrase